SAASRIRLGLNWSPAATLGKSCPLLWSSFKCAVGSEPASACRRSLTALDCRSTCLMRCAAYSAGPKLEPLAARFRLVAVTPRWFRGGELRLAAARDLLGSCAIVAGTNFAPCRCRYRPRHWDCRVSLGKAEA